MDLNKRDHASTMRSKKSNNLIASLAHLEITSSDLTNTFAFNVKDKWVTTKQTIENIAGTVEGWLSTRVYCDKETYKGMYQDTLKQWTILKHKIESIISNINTMKKKPHELPNVIGNFYNGLDRKSVV